MEQISSKLACCRLLPHPVKHICLDLAAEIQHGQALNRQLDDPRQEVRVAQFMMDAETHPNIVYPFSQTVEAEDVYLVFEYCNGGDLFALPEAHKPAGGLPEKQALAFMKQVFEGVRYLHEQVGITHRDLSLENVLLSNGVFKLSDFALSVPIDSVCDDVAGKDLYMSPEVVARGPYDPAQADVWSLGVMWFILLTGSQLLSLATASNPTLKAIAKHGIEAVLLAWGLEGLVEPETVALLDRMLCVDPVKRISLAGILADPLFKP